MNQLNALPNSQPSLPGLPIITYGVDGEGRVSTVSASTGQNPVTGTTYNYSSLPTQVNFGSGDSDIFAYDSNTLRMTQFKFNVGTQSQSLTGNLTWNANGTLGQLAITDQFNSADTQTCKYGDPLASPPVVGYDDLARLVSANCGTVEAQTFSYDPFGNINKTGNPGNSFLPSYDPATNHLSHVPSTSQFVASYDNNGNVTNDSNHTYAWDADGNSATLDGVGLTFDALDRMVEQNRSGSYTQVVYAPTGGKLALMSGQTLQKAFVPLPGQATAVYTSTGLDHYRHSDWLGSARLTSTPARAVASAVAYAPFGETYASSGTPDPSFTGMNPDTVSTDYDFLFREYSTQGRWPSPDPAGLTAVDPANPQSLNRYPYVRNNPLRLADPLGLDCIYMTGGAVDVVGGNCLSNSDNGLYVNGKVSSAWTDANGDLHYSFAPEDCGVDICKGVGTQTDFANWDWSSSSGSGFGDDSPFLDFWGGNCPTGWRLEPRPFGPSQCTPGHQLGDWQREPRDREERRERNKPSTLDARANALAQAINKTGVQAIANPCTPAALYVVSAVGGAGGGIIAGGEAGAALNEALAPHLPWIQLLNNTQPAWRMAAYNLAVNVYRKAADTVQNACNSLSITHDQRIAGAQAEKAMVSLS